MANETDPNDPHAGLLDVPEEATRVVLAGQKPDPGNYARGTFRGAVSAMITIILLAVATYVVPGLHWAQPWTPADPVPFWNLVGRELLGEGAEAAKAAEETQEFVAEALAEVAAEGPDDAEEAPPIAAPSPREPSPEDAPIPAYTPHDDDKHRIERRLERPEALDAFYAALTRSELQLPGAVTRAIHYGDSAIGNDGITGAIRSKLQARFGDAGHGFHLLGQPNASYRHQGVSFVERARWNLCFIIHGCRSDGHYGLGGTTFESTGGAEIRLGTAQKGAFGRRVSRFEVWYAAMPGGGTLKVKVDDEEAIELKTAAEALEDRWHVIDAEGDGEHTITLRAAGGGKVRAYGVVLEREAPGVVWDELSQIGALTRRLLGFDEAHIQRQIARRDPDLLVLMFGGNDMNTKGTMAKYRGELTEVVRLLRAGKPAMACLIMAPLDHGERDGQQIITRPIVPRIVDAQRTVAEAEGCAFFDTYQAMGGEGSMGRWFRSNPKLGSGDLSHLTHHGHKVVGALVYRALMDGYRDFRRRVEGRPIAELVAIERGEATADGAGASAGETAAAGDAVAPAGEGAAPEEAAEAEAAGERAGADAVAGDPAPPASASAEDIDAGADAPAPDPEP